MTSLLYPLFDALHLPGLKTYFWTVVAATLFWQALYSGVFLLYESIKPAFYQKLSFVKKLDWAMHHASFSHAILSFGLSLPMVIDKTLAADKVFGNTYYSGLVASISTGYFLWDTGICLYFMHLHGPGFAFHALACVTIFILSYTPVFHYFVGVFLFYELSTPFLNIHWFCDKTGRSGSTLQIVNGIILLLVFFSVRIVYGTYISGVFLKEVYSRWSEIPYHVSIIYGFANVSLNSLNAFWFYKMVKSVANRVRGGVVSDDRGGHVQLPAQKTETKKTT